MTLRCAYKRYEPVAAHGSNSRSMFSGVRVGYGGVGRLPLVLEFDDPDLCLDNSPDMFRCPVAMSDFICADDQKAR